MTDGQDSSSGSKHPLSVPLQSLRRGSCASTGQDKERLAVERVIAMAVVPVFSQPLAHAHLVVRRDGHIARIEQGVELLGQQHPVLHMVRRRSEVGLDMRRVQDNLGVFARDGAAPFVGAEQP